MSSLKACGIPGLAGRLAVFVVALGILAACGGGGGGASGGATPATSNTSSNVVNVQPTGSMLYQTNCEKCHKALAVSTKQNKTATEIQAAIAGNTGGMGTLSKLTPSEIQLIADALKTTIVSPVFDTKTSMTYQLNGSALLYNNSIRLTPNAQHTSGSAFLTNPFTLASSFGFNAYFTFTLGADGRSTRHADGFVFALQTVSSKAGGTGGNLGFGLISPSFGVEFDTFKNDINNDPDGNHVGIVTMGNVTHDAFAPVPSPVMLSDGGTYHVWVDYNGTTVEVRLNTTNDRSTSTLLISRAIDLKSIFPSQYVYFGFTGATGNDSQTHDIGSFYLSSTYKPEGISPAP